MATRKHAGYQVDEVVSDLKRKSSLKISEVNRTITHDPSRTATSDVGIKSKGKIDFLVNYHRWIYIR